MFKNIKQVIPWLSFAAITVAALILITSTTKRSSVLVESPETAAIAEKVLNTITGTTPQSLDDQSLISALEQADGTPTIAQVWLFAPDGQVKFARGATPVNAESASQLATRQVKGALAALPKGTLDQQQQMLLLVGSAIQAEGEHNDIYRYQVRVLTSPNNEVVGYVGITYDVSVAVSAAPGLWDIISTFGLLLSLIIYWVGLSVWTYLDAKQRKERALVWALFVLIGNMVALIAYLLVRNPTEKAVIQEKIK